MKRSPFTAEMERFIFENYLRYDTTELARRINEEFETDITKGQVRSFRRKHNLRRDGLTGKSIYPAEVQAFICENYKGTGYKQMVRLIYQRFGLIYTEKQIRAYYRNNKLNSGLLGNRFERGKVNCRKKKRTWSPENEKTWFKKGNIPHNHVPVGTERLRSSGYIWVKIAEPKKWRMKHLVIWEEANGPIPKGYKVYFRDGNRENCTLENLMLIEQRVIGILNKKGLSQYHGDLADTAVNVARVELAISDAKKRKDARESSR